jgi:hypothetical protein
MAFPSRTPPVPAEFDPFNLPMRTSDALQMLLPRVSSDPRPFDAAVAEQNEKRVREWFTAVIEPMSSGGTVPAGMVEQSLTLFVRAEELRGFMRLHRAGLIAEPVDVDGWRAFFEKASVGDLMKAGSTAVSYGWFVIKNHFKIRAALAHHRDFFEKYEVDDTWGDKTAEYRAEAHLARQKAAAANRAKFEGDRYDFWDAKRYDEIRRRVAATLLFNIDFEQVPVKDDISPKELEKLLTVTDRAMVNMSSLEKLSARRNNALVASFVVWLEKYGPTGTYTASETADDGLRKLPSKLAHALWLNFHDGTEVLKYTAFLERADSPEIAFDHETIGRWLELLEGDVGKLAELGPATVEFGHSLVRNMIQHFLVVSKKEWYSQPESEWAKIPEDFHELAGKVPPLGTGGLLTEERIKEFTDRATAVFRGVIRPRDAMGR